jgi:lipoprotein-anchoring transpeptidase ErfK/SrfK
MKPYHYLGTGRDPVQNMIIMSQLQRQGLPRAFSLFIKICGAGALLMFLGACTELARSVSKPEAAPEQPVVAEVPSTPTAAEEKAEKEKPSKLYEWNGEGRSVSRIVVDTDAQRARFYSGDEEIGWSTVASGLPKYPTPTGQFAVMEKVENKRSNLYGKFVRGGKVVKGSVKAGRDPVPEGASFEGAHMPFFMRLTYDGIGLHAGPIPRPGQPASHGCIRLPSTLAPVLFRHVSHGTQVNIVGSGPSYGDYMEKVRIAEAQRAAREAEQRRLAEQQAADAAAGVGMSAFGDGGMPADGLPQPPAHRPCGRRAGPPRCRRVGDAGRAKRPTAARCIRHPTGGPGCRRARDDAGACRCARCRKHGCPQTPRRRIPSAAAPAPAISLPQAAPAVPGATIPSAPPAIPPAAEPGVTPSPITTPAGPTREGPTTAPAMSPEAAPAPVEIAAPPPATTPPALTVQPSPQESGTAADTAVPQTVPAELPQRSDTPVLEAESIPAPIPSPTPAQPARAQQSSDADPAGSEG